MGRDTDDGDNGGRPCDFLRRKDNTEPDNPVFGNYIRSRRIMGAALLVLSANYMVHLLLRPRFTAPDAAFSTSLADWAKSFAVSDICAGNHQYTL